MIYSSSEPPHCRGGSGRCHALAPATGAAIYMLPGGAFHTWVCEPPRHVYRLCALVRAGRTCPRDEQASKTYWCIWYPDVQNIENGEMLYGIRFPM